ncbi:arginine biosynthesis ArgJ [Syncephalis pseudoplumigaleata]|uniref:Arginine biosynthesis bifunctional protein ArgJ, mitochondrial n=1 Tax=Syncephalis pseudoplumigaleata TaxID=1712513 RepID=A0A4V1J1R4_9FUNG|nr:arginine biosynthesis ArgJ [Syncephalis pseudoplumigaleata]|eukprot:RKP25969.1 arginine biosynthesis ArgJ [Syncephalis pseudoplumigaleata]
MVKDRFVPQHGTYPQGYRLGAIHCGVKKSGLDLTLLVADAPCTAAAVFTRNAFPAAPVQFDRALLARHHANPRDHPIRAILINAGCANAVTGTLGDKNAAAMAAAVNQHLAADADADATLVMSTGVIGQHLPMDRIEAGVPALYGQHLGRGHASWLAAAEGICTTDTFPKLRSRQYRLPSGREYCLAGVAKGAGMIHPNMATMLSFMCTDAAIQADALQLALRHAADRSFNAISVDGDTSTNDTVALLANGAAWHAQRPSSSLSADDADYPAFRDQLTEFSAELAQLVVRDGEGASKFVTVTVKHAHDFDQAKTIASTICTSALVKTALYGQDANWGRVLCAIGYAPGSETSIRPERVSVTFKAAAQSGNHSLPVLRHGEPVPVDEAFAAELLRNEDIEIHVDLGLGQEEATMWTCDFSHDYVSINADYRS